jgi:hypothetical protein
LQDREWIDRRAFNVQTRDRFGWIGETAEGPVHATRSQHHAFS